MICARDRYMVSFRGKRRRKTTREERDERVGEGGGEGERKERQRPEAAYGRVRIIPGRKGRIEMRERGRRGRMMIDRLSRGLEFDFSSRQREKRIPYTISFLHFFLFFFFFLFRFSFPVFHSLPSPPPPPEKVDAEFSGCAREIRYSLSPYRILAIFQMRAFDRRPVEGCHWER